MTDTTTLTQVKQIWEQRDRLGRDLSYKRLMEMWDYDHCDVLDAFGSIDGLARRLREVAPSLDVGPLKVWRGAMVGRGVHPGEVASGLSWTTSFGVACWFATIRAGLASFQEARGGRPFVFSLTATAEEIHYPAPGRHRADWQRTRGAARTGEARPPHPSHRCRRPTTTVAELGPNSLAPAEAVARWRQAAADYHAARYT